MHDYEQIKGPHDEPIAYRLLKGSSPLPPIVFLHGFKSDMDGSKAQFLHDYCAANDRTFLRFDCYAHGKSGGDFMDFTIGKALADTQFLMNTLIDRPAIVIGSSMGGWVGLCYYELAPATVHGFIGIAAAPDFTHEILDGLSDAQRERLVTDGFITQPSGYEQPYIFTRTLLEDGYEHCLLNRLVNVPAPVHLLQGKQDTSVHWHKAGHINDAIGGIATITLIEDGDHSLSRDSDLEQLKTAIEKMSA